MVGDAMKQEMGKWRRRHALTLASMLPDDPEDAVLVLDAARDIVERFMRPEPTDPLPKNVLMLRK
jgi:hypothetical protein